jgi:hypothetical protein
MAVFVGCFVLAPEAIPSFEAYTVPRNNVFDQAKSANDEDKPSLCLGEDVDIVRKIAESP